MPFVFFIIFFIFMLVVLPRIRRTAGLAERRVLRAVEARLGSDEEIDVQLSLLREPQGESQNQWVFSAAATCRSGSLPPGLSLKAAAWPRRQDVKTGDDLFDERFQVQGDPILVRAAFNGRARHLIHVLSNDGKLTIDQGTVRLAMKLDSLPFVEHLEPVARQTIELTKALRLRSEEISARLGDNAMSDPTIEVRLESFNALVASSKDQESVRATARGLLQCSAPASDPGSPVSRRRGGARCPAAGNPKF